jgi:plasmid stability protein
MTSVNLSNLSTETLDKLKALAQLHGRSLQEEIQHILETVAETQPSFTAQIMESVQAEASRMQEQLKRHARLKSDQLENPTDQPLNLSVTFEKLSILKQTISSLGDLTIQQAREEGRRF